MELPSEYPILLASKGRILRRTTRYNEALASFECARQLYPKSDWPVYHIGLCYLALGDSRQANNHFIHAIECATDLLSKEPTNVVVQLNLGLYLLATGQTEDARQAYQDGLAMHPTLHNLRDAQQELVDLREQVGDISGLSEAIQRIEQAIGSESTKAQ
jgi:tetratricopeptide (TPR) repeat protein